MEKPTIFETIAQDREITKKIESEITFDDTKAGLKPKSYTKMQRARMDKEENEKLEKLKALFLNYVQFYDDNYPKSTKGIEYNNFKMAVKKIDEDDKKTIYELLDGFGENRLVDLVYILQYSRKENFSGRMEDHYTYMSLNSAIKKRIPAFKDREGRLARKKKVLNFCYQRLSDDDKQLLKSMLKEGEPKEISEKLYICEECGFRAKKGSGLKSHMRVHDKSTEKGEINDE